MIHLNDLAVSEKIADEQQEDQNTLKQALEKTSPHLASAISISELEELQKGGWHSAESILKASEASLRRLDLSPGTIDLILNAQSAASNQHAGMSLRARSPFHATNIAAGLHCAI